MKSFHLSCPYTSLPVCHCRLHLAAPPKFHPITKAPRPAKENPLRRALLLEIAQSLSPAPGQPQGPSPTLTHHLFHRACHGVAPKSTAHRVAPALAAVMRSADEDASARLAEAEERFARARERALRASEDVAKLVSARDAEVQQGVEREEQILRDRFVERRADPRTPESDSADEVFERRRAAAKRRSKARARQRR